jgi:hypothetical protein
MIAKKVREKVVFLAFLVKIIKRVKIKNNAISVLSLIE